MKMRWLIGVALLVFSLSSSADDVTGGVYVATNNEDENSIIAWRQHADGSLSSVGEYGTGGTGSGDANGMDPLISSYGLWHSWDDRNVLVANIGDGTVSSLRVQDDLSLQLTSVVAAGGKKPNSIDSWRNLVYVASVGSRSEGPGPGNVLGFTLDDQGHLEEIPGSLRVLTGEPASIEFTENGRYLVVVEFNTGIIHSWAVQDDGQLSEQPVSSIDSPTTSEERFFALPVGTKLVTREDGNSTFLVTETRYVTQDFQFYPSSEESKAKYPFLQEHESQTGSMSSYNVDAQGQLSIVSADVLAGEDIWGGQQGVCWVTTSRDGEYAWTTNPHTSSLSTYRVDVQDGSLELAREIAFQPDDYNEFFLDMDLSADGNYVNVISGNTGKTWVFRINHDNGDLEVVGAWSGGPQVHSYGLVTIPRHQ